VKAGKLALLTLVCLLSLALLVPLACLAWFSLCLKQDYARTELAMPTIPERAYLYVQRGIKLERGPASLEQALVRNEAFLSLKFRKPIRLVVCKNDRESARIFKLFSTKASGFAFADDLIVLNYDNLISLGYTLDAIIAHESSHSLLKQNMKSPFQMLWTFSWRSLWFSEGLALCNQGLSVLSDEDFGKAMEGEGIVSDLARDDFRVNPGNRRLDYGLYERFMGFLIERHGMGALREYVGLMVGNYAQSARNYHRAFGNDLWADLRDFEGRLGRR
jgi:hypothetical protein